MFACDLLCSFCSTIMGTGTVEMVGAASPPPANLRLLGRCPFNGEPEQKSYYFLYFRFVFNGEQAKR